MRYVVLKDYINPAGELIKTAEIVELPDDKFTSGLIQHDFITKAGVYDELRAMAVKMANSVSDMCEQIAKALGSTEDEGDER